MQRSIHEIKNQTTQIYSTIKKNNHTIKMFFSEIKCPTLQKAIADNEQAYKELLRLQHELMILDFQNKERKLKAKRKP